MYIYIFVSTSCPHAKLCILDVVLPAWLFSSTTRAEMYLWLSDNLDQVGNAGLRYDSLSSRRRVLEQGLSMHAVESNLFCNTLSRFT